MSGIVIKTAVGMGLGALAVLLAWWYNKKKQEQQNSYQQYYGQGTNGPPEARCSLCTNDFRNFSGRLLLPCGHFLHPDCAQLLFVQGANSCPRCRRRVGPEFVRSHFPDIS